MTEGNRKEQGVITKCPKCGAILDEMKWSSRTMIVSKAWVERDDEGHAIQYNTQYDSTDEGEDYDWQFYCPGCGIIVTKDPDEADNIMKAAYESRRIKNMEDRLLDEGGEDE